jgi:hypothetical protein
MSRSEGWTVYSNSIGIESTHTVGGSLIVPPTAACTCTQPTLEHPEWRFGGGTVLSLPLAHMPHSTPGANAQPTSRPKTAVGPLHACLPQM